MRLVKKLPSRDEHSLLASKIFDLVIKGNTVPLPFGRIEFHLRDRDHVVVGDDTVLLCMNYADPFLKEGDIRAIRTKMKQLISRVTVQRAYGELPGPIEEIIANRSVKDTDDLVYVFYIQLNRTRLRNVMDFARASVPWLSLKYTDQYNSELMRQTLDGLENSKIYERKAKTLIHFLDKDLSNYVNRMNAVDAYKALSGGI